MVKHNLEKSRFQKSKSRRHIKTLADVRLLQKPSKTKRGHPAHVCTLCGDPGALLACIKCFKLFHLSCLQVTIYNLPFSQWACNACSQDYHNDFLISLTEYIEIQSQEKEELLKKLNNKLNKTLKTTTLKKFESKYSNLIKHGQISYPIPDEILWAKPKLHDLDYKAPLPEHIPQIPSSLFEDLIYICDFSQCFQNILSTPCLKCESLYSALVLTEETFLSKNLHIALMRPLVIIMLKSETFRKKGLMLNYLICKTKKIVPLERLLDLSYLTFLENIFRNDLWNDVIEDIDKDLALALKGFSFVNDYHALPVGYKVQVLVVLSDLLLETSIFNEECNKRLELQTKIYREINELQSIVKQKSKKNDEKTEVEEKLDRLKDEIKTVPIRTLSFGTDRYFREYYYFPWDKARLYIKTLEKDSREIYKWTYLENKHEIEQLLDNLSDKGIREAHLIDQINEILTKNDFSPEKAENLSPDIEDHKKHIENVYNLSMLKNWLKDLHLSVAQTLRVTPSSTYLNTLEISDIITIPSLIFNFHKAFTEKECAEEIHKVTKKLFGLWDFCELNAIWENSVKECQNISEMFLCMHLLEILVKKFNEDNKVIEVHESAYSLARRSYRLERLSRIKKDVEKEQDLDCYICGEPGLVALCDKCPKVAHIECLEIDRLPQGEWLCPICVEKSNASRLARSKQIKY